MNFTNQLLRLSLIFSLLNINSANKLDLNIIYKLLVSLNKTKSKVLSSLSLVLFEIHVLIS